ncbi:MAG TPA: ATP-binding protein, partial [Chthoniobacterales bacterium]
MFESLRAFGYELPTALADLIDNSVFAGAENVWIDFEWDGENSMISVTDDGRGMTEKELFNAMRPGSRNPRELRDPQDLGRFGLGLKTASLSQGRRLTVRTKLLDSPTFTRCWDLDYVAHSGDWCLLRKGDDQAEKQFAKLNKLASGTAVVWQKLDQLVAGQTTENEGQHSHFLARIDGVREHLAMVFHRLMEGRNRLHVFVNDREVEPWDPFLTSEPATHRLPPTTLLFDGESVFVEPFVLPHLSK